MNKNDSLLNEIKKVLPKNMKTDKIIYIENAIKKYQDDKNKSNNINEDMLIEIKEVKKENTQLRLDNLNLQKENKKKDSLILKLYKDNEEINKNNEELAEMLEEIEKLKINNIIDNNTNDSVKIYMED
jgi:hypothetical protein